MGGGWQETDNCRRKSAIERVACRQLNIVTTGQLLECGVSERVISYRTEHRRLIRLHRGVYAIHPPPYTREQRWLAAVLACGRGAFLCGASAGALQEIVDPPVGTIHVCSPTRTGRSRPGITVHLRVVDPRDARRVAAIPCVSADLVLIELAPDLDEAELEIVLVAAESKGLLKRHRLAELIAERAGRPGIGKLASITALEPALARSGLELLMLPIARMAGVGRPLVNHPIEVGRGRPLTVDCAWPKLRMVVEADSQRFHGDWEQAAVDRERDQLLALAGWRCHRFVRGVVAADPDGAAVRLRSLAAARAEELQGRSGGAGGGA